MSDTYDSALPPLQPPSSKASSSENGSDFLRNHIEATATGAPQPPTPADPATMTTSTPEEQDPEEEQKRIDSFNKRFRRPQTTDPRDFHYVSPARWAQLRRDLEHCERTGKSPKTTLNNIAKVVDAGTMAETDEGCPAETACSECNKRAGVVCYAWRDPSKGRSCAYCKKQGISRCDAKQAEMRSEMERKVDAMSDTIQIMLGHLEALTKDIAGVERGRKKEWRARRGLAKLPSSVAAMRARQERGGNESGDEEEYGLNHNQDPSLVNGNAGVIDATMAGMDDGGISTTTPQSNGYQLHNGNDAVADAQDNDAASAAMAAALQAANAGVIGENIAHPQLPQTEQQVAPQGRKRPQPSGASDSSTPRKKASKDDKLDWEAVNGADIITGIKSGVGVPGPSSNGENGTSMDRAPDGGAQPQPPQQQAQDPSSDAAAPPSNSAEDQAGSSSLSQLASSAVAGFRPL